MHLLILDNYLWKHNIDGYALLKFVKYFKTMGNFILPQNLQINLQVGSVDMLHCYYAHGEENEKFQRRSYWMLEDDLMHIVLVHYREVKDKPSLDPTTSLSHTRDVQEVMQVSQMHNSVSSISAISQTQPLSQTILCDSPSSSHTSEYEDAESAAYLKQNSSRQITIDQVPDTTLSLRCGDMMIDE